MKINLSRWDRTVRLLVGFLMVAWALAGGPFWAYFAIYFSISGAFRFCPLYAIIRIRTAS